MKTHYTPEIDELSIGQEITLMSLDNYFTTPPFELPCNAIITKLDDYPLLWVRANTHPTEYEIYTFQIQIKYLDQEDIESLGWEKWISGPNSIGFSINKKHLYLTFYTDSTEITIDNGESHESRDTYFQGTIRNLSELKKLMKQLNIQTT